MNKVITLILMAGTMAFAAETAVTPKAPAAPTTQAAPKVATKPLDLASQVIILKAQKDAINAQDQARQAAQASQAATAAFQKAVKDVQDKIDGDISEVPSKDGTGSDLVYTPRKAAEKK